jgi:hypothetical protein
VGQGREGQVGVADPPDAAVGRRNDVVEALAGQVGQLHPLEVGPQRVDRVQLGRGAGQPESGGLEPSDEGRVAKLAGVAAALPVEVTGDVRVLLPGGGWRARRPPLLGGKGVERAGSLFLPQR